MELFALGPNYNVKPLTETDGAPIHPFIPVTISQLAQLYILFKYVPNVES